MRRPLALALAAAAWFLYLSRRRDARRERVHLYYEDGSAVTLERDAPGAERLLALAHQAL